MGLHDVQYSSIAVGRRQVMEKGVGERPVGLWTALILLTLSYVAPLAAPLLPLISDVNNKVILRRSQQTRHCVHFLKILFLMNYFAKTVQHVDTKSVHRVETLVHVNMDCL